MRGLNMAVRTLTFPAGQIAEVVQSRRRRYHGLSRRCHAPREPLHGQPPGSTPHPKEESGRLAGIPARR